MSQPFRGESGNFGGGKERTVIGGKKLNSVQREILNFSPTINNNNKLRCIITRLGSILITGGGGERGEKGMVYGGMKVSHKCLGGHGSQISYNVLHIKERDAISVHIRMDNMTALSYLIKMGDIKNQELTVIRKEIWQYLLKKKITITAKYLPGSMNVKADKESRKTRDSSEWKLNPTIYMKLYQITETQK